MKKKLKKLLKENIGAIVSIAGMVTALSGFLYIKYTGGTVETARAFGMYVVTVTAIALFFLDKRGVQDDE